MRFFALMKESHVMNLPIQASLRGFFDFYLFGNNSRKSKQAENIDEQEHPKVTSRIK